MLDLLGPLLAGLGSFLMSAWATHQKHKAQDHQRIMELALTNNKHQLDFIKAQIELLKADPHFAFTRRLLALGITFGFMVAVFVMPYLFEQVGYIYEVPGKSYLFGLFQGSPTFDVIKGIPFEVIMTFNYSIHAITGFYFGNSIMKR